MSESIRAPAYSPEILPCGTREIARRALPPTTAGFQLGLAGGRGKTPGGGGLMHLKAAVPGPLGVEEADELLPAERGEYSSFV